MVQITVRILSWLRVDDGFSRHPKVTALTHRDRWTWVDLLCYCARYETDGYLPENIREFVPGATPKLLERCTDLGLLDDLEDGQRIHDWQEYAPKDKTAAERQARWRRSHSTVTRNGDRNGRVTANVTDATVTEPSTSRAGTARVPVPSPTTDLETNPVSRSAPSAQTLTAEYVDACHAHEIETPRRLIGQIAQATAQLLGEGVDPDRIRAGYRRMVTRGIVQPSLLPNFVAEASIPSELTRPPNAGLTGDQITEIGRRMSQ